MSFKMFWTTILERQIQMKVSLKRAVVAKESGYGRRSDHSFAGTVDHVSLSMTTSKFSQR